MIKKVCEIILIYQSFDCDKNWDISSKEHNFQEKTFTLLSKLHKSIEKHTNCLYLKYFVYVCNNVSLSS